MAKTKEMLTKEVTNAQLEFLAQLAYTMDLDDIIHNLKDPFLWKKVIPSESQEERLSQLAYYEEMAQRSSCMTQYKMERYLCLTEELKKCAA